jgi:hypothetical protein
VPRNSYDYTDPTTGVRFLAFRKPKEGVADDGTTLYRASKDSRPLDRVVATNHGPRGNYVLDGSGGSIRSETFQQMGEYLLAQGGQRGAA